MTENYQESLIFVIKDCHMVIILVLSEVYAYVWNYTVLYVATMISCACFYLFKERSASSCYYTEYILI